MDTVLVSNLKPAKLKGIKSELVGYEEVTEATSFVTAILKKDEDVDVITEGTNAEICYTTRDFVSDQGQPVLAVAIYDVKGDANKIVRFLMPLGLLLQPGIRFGVDNAQPTGGRYAICFPNGCFAEAQVKDDFINAMKKGNTLNVSVQNQGAREVTFAIPLADFAKGFDGAPIDPKVLEEQQKQLQDELAKRQDELRKRLGGSGASAAPGTPGAPAAPGANPRRWRSCGRDFGTCSRAERSLRRRMAATILQHCGNGEKCAGNNRGQ